MSPQFNVIQHGHPLEKLDILKCARNAKFGNGMSGNSKDVLAFVKYLTFLGGIKTADTVQQAGFSGSVGTNNGENLTVEKFSVNIVEGLNASKSQRQILNFYNEVITQSDLLFTLIDYGLNLCTGYR